MSATNLYHIWEQTYSHKHSVATFLFLFFSTEVFCERLLTSMLQMRVVEYVHLQYIFYVCWLKNYFKTVNQIGGVKLKKKKNIFMRCDTFSKLKKVIYRCSMQISGTSSSGTVRNAMCDPTLISNCIGRQIRRQKMTKQCKRGASGGLTVPPTHNYNIKKCIVLF